MYLYNGGAFTATNTSFVGNSVSGPYGVRPRARRSLLSIYCGASHVFFVFVFVQNGGGVALVGDENAQVPATFSSTNSVFTANRASNVRSLFSPAAGNLRTKQNLMDIPFFPPFAVWGRRVPRVKRRLLLYRHRLQL